MLKVRVFFSLRLSFFSKLIRIHIPDPGIQLNMDPRPDPNHLMWTCMYYVRAYKFFVFLSNPAMFFFSVAILVELSSVLITTFLFWVKSKKF